MQRERRHDHDAAGDELPRHGFEARGRHPLPLQLEGGPAAEEIVVRLEEPPGIVRRGIGDAAQMLDAGDAGFRRLQCRRLAEMRGHRHAAGAGLGGDHGDE